MSEIIFKPLGMTRSTIRPLAAMTYSLALGHNIENGSAVIIRGWRIGNSTSTIEPNGCTEKEKAMVK